MRQRGTVLLAVLVVTAMAAMVAAGLLFRMHAEVKASSVAGRGEQAYAAAMSGIERAIAALRAHPDDSEFWFDDPDIFYAQLVGEVGGDRWYFTVWAPSPIDPLLVRHGVTDESSKINLNEADEQTLLALPGMTVELAEALIDYRDADDEPMPQGAEQDSYSQLDHPYLIRNGPLATVDELLLVRGFDGTIVYGEDANLNGLLDPNEDDGEETFPADAGDGRLSTGLRGVATTYARMPADDGQERIDLNGDLQGIDGIGLPDQAVQFIRQYRAEGHTFRHPSELLEATYETTQASSGDTGGGSGRGSGRRAREADPDEDAAEDAAESAAEGGAQPAGTTIASGVGADELPLVMERLTASPPSGQQAVAPVVNVNTASAAVLALVPGLNEGLAGQIVDARASLGLDERSNVAWLYTRNLVEAEAFKQIAPLLATRGYQFHIQCVGYGLPSGRYCVIEAIVDLAGGEPQIVYLRNLTRLGMPFVLSEER